MAWLEIIHVRSSAEGLTQAANMLASMLQETESHAGLLETRVYVHGRIPGDLAVHLQWDASRSVPSVLGHLLAERLREVGLVDHSWWEKVQS